MNPKNIFSWLLILLGEALIILSFLYFGRDEQTEILTLNIAVSSIIYAMMFIDILIPWVDFNNKTQKTIGSIGLRWFFTFVYVFAAIALMIVSNTLRPLPFTHQLLFHGILFFMLLLGLIIAISSSNKVEEVYIDEKQRIGGIDVMRIATRDLLLKLDSMKEIPPEIVSTLHNIQENLRFLSPGNTKEANELEMKFIYEIRYLKDSITGSPFNIDEIREGIRNCEQTLKLRKHLYSN
jgi:hypothetical protein